MSEHARLALRDVSGLLKDLLGKLEGDQGTFWANVLKKFLRKENPWESNLGFNQNVDFPGRTAPFTARDHFQTGDGLHIWEGFEDRVLSAAGSAETTPATKGVSFDLLKSVVDEDIRAELPEGHAFDDVDIFCAHLSGMLNRQAGGRAGPLLTNGYANLFYVQVAGGVFVVLVNWSRGSREWHVRACDLVGSPWIAGSRVFSAAAVA